MAESASALLEFALRKRAAADAASPDGQMADILRSAVVGGLRGREMAQAEQAAELERQSKIVSLQAKMEEMKAAAQNRRIATNVAKRYGFLPADPMEKDAARQSALDALAKKSAPTDTSSAGRIASLMVGGREYDAVPGFTQSSGVSLSYRPTGGDEGGPRSGSRSGSGDADRRAKLYEEARALAKDAARRWRYGQGVAMAGGDQAELAKYANVQPTPDEEEMFIPEMLSYLDGDGTGYAQAKRGRRKKSAEDLISALDDMDAKITELKSKGQDWKPFNEQPEDLDKLTRRRDALLKYGWDDLVQLQRDSHAELTALSRKGKKMSPDERAHAIALGRRIKQIHDLGGQ